MQGFELCRRFFFSIGLVAIQQNLPECQPYLAAGIPGGSHCYGNDDSISRDHGWGPAFVVWFDQVNYDRFAVPIQALLDQLPHEFMGHQWQLIPNHTCRVYEIGRYTRNLTGWRASPTEPIDWLHIPEHALFEITHRPILYDATGQVTRQFAAFQQYPEDVWKKRLCACLAWTWRWGVEYVRRAEKRGDQITATMDWCRFAEFSMRSAFLLNHSYAPYHKWLYREFLKLPSLASQIAPLISQGFAQEADKTSLVMGIIDIYLQALEQLGYQPITNADEQPHIAYADQVLYRYARGIQRTIEDSTIRGLDVYADVVSPPSVPTWGWFNSAR